METTSQRSRMSYASSRARQIMKSQMNAAEGTNQPILEEDEFASNQRMLKLVDKDGKTIELSAEQLLLLE